MFLINFFMAISFSQSCNSGTPMKMVLFILLSGWFSAFSIHTQGGSTWIPIILIMMFNGGLMVLYIFAVAMSSQEKSSSTGGLFYLFFFLFFFFYFPFSAVYNEVFSSLFLFSNQVIVFMTFLIIILMIPMVSFTVCSFKSVKSIL